MATGNLPSPLLDRILSGLNVTGVGVVNGTTLTGSEAFRRFTNTNQLIANGEVVEGWQISGIANWSSGAQNNLLDARLCASVSLCLCVDTPEWMG